MSARLYAAAAPGVVAALPSVGARLADDVGRTAAWAFTRLRQSST